MKVVRKCKSIALLVASIFVVYQLIASSGTEDTRDSILIKYSILEDTNMSSIIKRLHQPPATAIGYSRPRGDQVTRKPGDQQTTSSEVDSPRQYSTIEDEGEEEDQKVISLKNNVNHTHVNLSYYKKALHNIQAQHGNKMFRVLAKNENFLNFSLDALTSLKRQAIDELIANVSPTDSAMHVGRPHHCGQTARLAAIYSHCPLTELTADYDLMSDRQIRLISKHLRYSRSLKMLGCWTYKTGWSTLNMLFANNSASDPIPTHMVKSNIRFMFPKYGVGLVKTLRIEEQRYMLKNYYKFMITRHPLDRLVSAYVDKIVPRHDQYRRNIGKKIVAKLRPELVNDSIQRYLPSMYISFLDLINFIAAGGDDMHIRGPYDNICHPCRVKYDYVMKTETFADDSEHLVLKHMRARGLGTKRNSNRPFEDSLFDRPLREYGGVSDGLIGQMIDKYNDDFHKYSYGVTFRGGVLYANCNSTSGCC